MVGMVGISEWLVFLEVVVCQEIVKKNVQHKGCHRQVARKINEVLMLQILCLYVLCFHVLFQ